MAGLPWIKVAVVLPGHPKLQMLEKFLGVADGLGVLVRLWCWTATYYPAGEFPASAASTMEKVAAADLSITYARMPMGMETGGPPQPGDVTDALVSSGWLDPMPGEVERYRVHDWDDFQSAHADKATREKEQIRERVRKFRNRKRNASSTVTGNAAETVTGNGVTAEREREREKEKEKEIPGSNVSRIPAPRRDGGTKLGPLGLKLIQAVEQGLNRGLLPLKTQAEADDFEALVTKHGVDEAYQFVAATCRRRDADPQSVAWVAKILSPSAGHGGAQ